MRNNTIYLEATGEEEKKRLKIAVYKPDNVIYHYEYVPTPMGSIERYCQEIADALNKNIRKDDAGYQEVKKLRQLGGWLSTELLTENIRQKLRKTDAEYLILKLDDHLVHIQWELLCIDDQFLCQRFNMGRLTKTRQKISENSARSLSRPLKMMILADLNGDLPFAYEEGKVIYNYMTKLNQEHGAAIIAPVLIPDIELGEIKKNLKEYDFVHVTGHADYNPQEPAQSGWRIPGGNFTVNDIDEMSYGLPMPTLVFSNACQSARTEEWKGERNAGSFGLANAFLSGGVRHYAGTLWEVMDETSSYFAREFYERLCSGKSIGEAIRQAGCDLEDEHGPDICWVSYVLYGDPRVRYFRGDTKITVEKQKKQEKAVGYSRTRSLFNYALNTTRLSEIQNWLIVYLAIIVLAFTMITYNYIEHIKFADTEKIKTEERKADKAEAEIQQILQDRADKKQEKIKQWFEELRKISPGSEKHISDSLTMALFFSSQAINQTREKFILQVIQNQISESQSDFILLERDSLDKILPDLIEKYKSTPPEERTPLKVLFPKLILIIEVYDFDTGSQVFDSNITSIVYMRLVEAETTKFVYGQFEKLRNDKSLLEQKKALTENLLEKLKEFSSI
ncbi:MAG: CHAT domain-containing protein [Desulfobacterales bacterium]|nr:CHAT domain-containing protein [Desulfobacterales bacterium]